jgi:DNA-binding CsgD family transcriptional regulator
LRHDVPDLRVLVLPGEGAPVVIDDVCVCVEQTKTPVIRRCTTDDVHLTPREREVLAHIANGCASRDIAAALGISLRTVETHREHLNRKLGVSSLAGLIRYAIEQHITES